MAVGGILITKARTGLDIYLCTFVCRLIMACLQERDRPSIKPSDKFSSGEILRSIRPPHGILIFVVSFLMGTCLSSIVSKLGLSRKKKTQLLNVGPFAIGFFGAFIR